MQVGSANRTFEQLQQAQAPEPILAKGRGCRSRRVQTEADFGCPRRQRERRGLTKNYTMSNDLRTVSRIVKNLAKSLPARGELLTRKTAKWERSIVEQ